MAVKTFQFEREADCLIVTPLVNLRELDFPAIEGGAQEVLAFLDQGAVKNVIIDFQNTDYYGSTALGFFVKLWKRVRQRNGKLAFCNVSTNEKEILSATKLDTLWPICETRDDARRAVGLAS